MTTLADRDKTALLVVDVQNLVVENAFRREEVIAAIRALIVRARSLGTPVVWVQHSGPDLTEGTPDWEIVPELQPGAEEPHVRKRHGDSFEGTNLEDILAQLHVGRLVVVGAETDACIRSTAHGAFTRGYDVALVSDAHTAGDKTQWGAPPVEQVIAHTNLYWQFQTAPGRTAEVAEASAVRLD
ncbi:isochorismatase family protein [Brevibacterium sp.]|uniref:isochorismatase family protein n=1 Tax=Brevibacterium sp. TaxID=1701 RepID=UPI0025C60C79|nr:isochorismatase family protein [Brevibacterium sp.]